MKAVSKKNEGNKLVAVIGDEVCIVYILRILLLVFY